MPSVSPAEEHEPLRLLLTGSSFKSQAFVMSFLCGLHNDRQPIRLVVTLVTFFPRLCTLLHGCWIQREYCYSLLLLEILFPSCPIDALCFWLLMSSNVSRDGLSLSLFITQSVAAWVTSIFPEQLLFPSSWGWGGNAVAVTDFSGKMSHGNGNSPCDS